jgi:hypothetical protein
MESLYNCYGVETPCVVIVCQWGCTSAAPETAPPRLCEIARIGGRFISHTAQQPTTTNSLSLRCLLSPVSPSTQTTNLVLHLYHPQTYKHTHSITQYTMPRQSGLADREPCPWRIVDDVGGAFCSKYSRVWYWYHTVSWTIITTIPNIGVQYSGVVW